MKTTLIICLTLLSLSVGFNFYQYYFPRTVNIPGKTIIVPGAKESTVVYQMPGGNEAATSKVIQDYKEKTIEAKQMVAEVKTIPGLESAKDITAITEAKMKLEIELNAAKMTINDVQNEKKTWEDKFNKITVDNKNNIASSISEVSPKIVQSEKREKFLQPKVPYTTITSENPSAVFYGVKSYTFKNPQQKDFLELNLKAQAIYLNKEVTPFAGLELIFNPDGRFKYVGGAGYFYDVKSGTLVNYFSGGINFNLVRF